MDTVLEKQKFLKSGRHKMNDNVDNKTMVKKQAHDAIARKADVKPQCEGGAS